MDQDRPERHFPDTFSIKAVGRDEDDFAEFVAAVVKSVVGEGGMVEYRTRASRNGKYVSVTLSFIAEDQCQLDQVFSQVSAEQRVVWVL